MSFKLELKENLDPTLKEDAYDYDENSDKDQLIWDHLSMKIADNCKELLGIDSEQVPEAEWVKLIDTLVRICKMTKGFEYKEESLNCPACGTPYDKDGRCYNQDCEQYDPLSQYFDEPEEDFKLDLKEAFNSNFPEWIMKGLQSQIKGRDTDLKRSLVKKHIDLANATFIETLPPQSNRDPVLKDPNRLAVFHIRDAGGTTYLYTPDGQCNPYVKVDDTAWEHKYVDQLSWKWILDHTMDYGYFDMANPDTTASRLRTQRMGAKKGSVERGLGQYKRTGYDGETYWVTVKGEDKSGYKLDPQKYTRMLDNVNLNNYSARLESHYAKIEEVRAGIIEALQSADLLNKDYLAKGSFSSGVTGDISDAIRGLERAIYHYKELCTSVERITSRPEKYTDERYSINDAIKDAFRFNSNNVREYLKDAQALVAHIKSNPVRPVVED